MIKQGSPEWFALRVGKITASRVRDAVAKPGSAARENYKAQIVAERLTGLPQNDRNETEAMRRGTEKEPFARMAYEAATGSLVDQVGFISLGNFGCSPDGLVNGDGGIEIKCPNTATHIRWITAGEIPAEHRKQVLWSLAITGREWWDFVSYDDRVPDDLQLFVRRLMSKAEGEAIVSLMAAAKEFDSECEVALAALRAKK